MGGTNAWFGCTADDSARIAVATNAVTQQAAIKTIVADLRNKGARGAEPAAQAFDDPILGELYIGIVDPFVEMDITTFSGFVNANQYANVKRLWNGEAGTLDGVRWVRSNTLPTLTSAAAVANTVATAAGATFTGHSVLTKVVSYVITGVDVQTGYERLIYQQGSGLLATQATPSPEQSVSITMPAEATFTYNVYVGSAVVNQSQVAAGQERLHTSGLTAGALLTLG